MNIAYRWDKATYNWWHKITGTYTTTTKIVTIVPIILSVVTLWTLQLLYAVTLGLLANMKAHP